MTFKLERKAAGAVLTKFHITDGKGTDYGSVNVPNEAASDLLRHWRGAAPAAATAGKQARAAQAMVAALKRGPRLNKQAILRGC
jgi:hypothetical protein